MARILIVEDEGIIAMKTQMDLEQLGHEVVGIVDNGKKAIEIARREKPDLVLMDIVLKGSLNGIEATRVICQGNECKIIFMTAHADGKFAEAAKETNHVGLLYKPFEQHHLKQALDRALD